MKRVFADVGECPALSTPRNLPNYPCAAVDHSHSPNYMLCDSSLKYRVIGRLALYCFGDIDGSCNGLLLRLACRVDGTIGVVVFVIYIEMEDGIMSEFESERGMFCARIGGL